MGELRKKIGMTFMQIMNYMLIIILLFALASVLQYRLLEKTAKTNFDIYIQYIVYFLFALSFIFFIVFYLKKKAITAMNVYENGIILKKNGRETIMYSDVPTYYLIPHSDKSVKYLIIEKGNGSRVLVDIDYAGEDFIDYFQRDYMTINTNKALEKINNGTDLMFGMLSKKQNFMLKLFKGKNTVRKLEFEDKFYISKDTLKYRDLEYDWGILDVDYDVQTKNIEIKDKNNNIIISTYFSHVEKGEFAFNLMDYLMEESKNIGSELLIEDNNQNIEVDSVSDDTQADIQSELLQITDESTDSDVENL